MMHIALKVSAVVELYLGKFPEEERKEKCLELLEIGVAVMDRISVNRDVEFFKKETENLFLRFNSSVAEMSNKLSSDLKEMYTNSEDILKEHKENVVSEFEESLKGQIDRMNLITSATSELVEKMLQNAGAVSTDELTRINDTLVLIKDKFNPNDNTSYLGSLRESIISMQKRLEDLVDENRTDSFSFKIKEKAVEFFGEDSPIIKNVEDVISGFVNNVNGSLISLREEIAKKEGSVEMLEKTAVKGFNFEDDTFNALEIFASRNGDVVSHTGKETKGTSSKKGDFIYEFSDGLKFVIECKDEAIGLKPMLKYMDEAIENREVEFGLLLVKRADQLPKQVGLFNLYEGNKLFVSFENLEFALRWVRMYLLKVRNQNNSSGVIDIMAVRDNVEKISNSLKSIATMKTKLTKMSNNVESSIEEITSLINVMERDINFSIGEIKEEIGN